MTTKVASQLTVTTPAAAETSTARPNVVPLAEVVRVVLADSRVRPQRYLDEVVVPRSAGE